MPGKGRPFEKGWKGGPGRPKGTTGIRCNAKAMRRAFQDAVTKEDLAEIAELMRDYVKDGLRDKNPDAAILRLLLDRILGPPQQVEVLERLDELEKKAGIVDEVESSSAE